MKTRNYAAIDIGSNAVRLLIKKVSRDESSGVEKFSKELLLRIPLRLGFDVFGQGRISPTKAGKMLRLIKSYKQLMKIYDVEAFRACATSAMRDAENGAEIIKKIKKETDIKIEIIDGKEEAYMIYSNHLECLEDRNGNYMYVDVGGGSTEINLLTNGQLAYSQSFNIGTVRILTGGVTEAAWQQLREEIAEQVKDIQEINIIGSGGNINKLYKLIDKKDKKEKRIPVTSLQQIYDELHILTDEARMEMYNLKPDRADVIVPAAKIFLTIAEVIHAQFIHVPVIGLSDGIIDELYSADKAEGLI